MRRKRGVIYKAGPSNLALFFLGAAIIAWFVFILASGFPLFAWVYYQAKPNTSIILSEVLSQTVKGKSQEVKTGVKKEELELPPVNKELPEGHFLEIPEIMVDTEILEGDYSKHEEVFRKGVWRVPDFAIPERTHLKPMILVAHRFGYLEWDRMYRRHNSFFNLPKLEGGEKVEIVWDQRKYIYEVKKVVEAEEVEDYSSDLILYTCKFLVSPVKYFVYAERIN